MSLKDVFHVRGLTKYLMSASQLTENENYVLFDHNDVQVLSNLKTVDAKVAFTGQKESSYVLTAGEAYVKKTSKNDGALLWHARLGHVGYQLLQTIEK